jgi:hypothetical protein
MGLAIKEAGKAGQIVATCVDAEPAHLSLIKEGVLTAAIGQKRELFTYFGLRILFELNHSPLKLCADDKAAGIRPAPDVVTRQLYGHARQCGYLHEAATGIRRRTNMRRALCLLILLNGLFWLTPDAAGPASANSGTAEGVKELTLESKYLNLPVKNGAAKRRMSLSADGRIVREFEIELAEGEPDFWVFLDVSTFRGKTSDHPRNR